MLMDSGEKSSGPGAVKMDVLPVAVVIVPDPRLFKCNGARSSSVIFTLDKPNVGDDRGIVTQ